ncbi:ABC transporter ATP-binding protein, partial [Enterococcus gallinarum]
MKNILTMKNIVKTFGSGHTEVTALKGINFNVKQGEFVSIIGPSGSGKSTFLTISGGLQTPTSGEIAINGQSFSDLSEKKRADLRFKEIGFILQSSNLIPFLKVKEQFYLVDRVSHQKQNETVIDDLLKSLDIYDLKESYPRDLSGGERQRVAIARALFNDPSLILADEPTASLDTDHAFEVVKLLVKEAHEKQKATVMVTHDARMIKW